MTSTKEATGAKKPPEPPHWAQDRGIRAVERRRRRQAEQDAAASAEDARRNVPLELLHQRFAQIAGPIAEAVAFWSHTTGTPLDSEATPGSLRVASYGARPASVELHVQPDAGGVRVTIRGPGRGDQREVALDADDFEPGPLARAIAEEFLGHCEAVMEIEMLQEEVSR